MENVFETNEKISCSWCWKTHKQSQWLHTTLSELDKSTRSMLILMKQEEGDTVSHRAESYYEKRPELMKNVEEFRRCYHLLAEYCGHLSIESTLRRTPLRQLESFNYKGKISSNSSHSTREFFTDPMDEDTSDLDDSFGSGVMGDEIEKAELSIEQRALHSAKLSKMVEETVRELVRRNDEKREVKKELKGQIECLMEENSVVRKQLKEAMSENVALKAKFEQKKTNKISLTSNDSRVVNGREKNAKRSKLSRLKFMMLRSCVSNDTV